jgi:hypothetical protein
MSLTKNWNLINRAIVPVIYQDKRFPDDASDWTLQAAITFLFPK